MSKRHFGLSVHGIVTRTLATLAFALGLAALNTGAQVYLYNNSAPSSDQNSRLSAVDNLWFGDEVVLGGNYPSSSTMTHFDFQYWAQGTSGLTVDVALLYNTGTPYNGYATPDFGNAVYTFSGFALSDTVRNTLSFDAGTDFSLSGINLSSGTLTLAVRFNFNGGGGTAGVDLYNPPVEGSSLPDYWTWDQFSGTWQLTTNNVFGTVNFGMTVAAPEPSSFSILIMGGLMMLGFRRFFGRK